MIETSGPQCVYVHDEGCSATTFPGVVLPLKPQWTDNPDWDVRFQSAHFVVLSILGGWLDKLCDITAALNSVKSPF